MNFPAVDLTDTFGTNIRAFWIFFLANAQKLVRANLYL